MTSPRADYQPARRLIPTMRVVVESFLGLVGIFLIAWAAYGQNVGGTGGSSGGGGGGSVTQGTRPWVEALSTTPSIANGNGVVPTQGGSALSATNGGYTNLLQGNAAIASGNPLFAQLVAGSAIAGKFGIDQTTAGTTNGISIVGVNAATALAGAGAVGTGAQRIAVGQDTTTIAGSAPGTAGTASANVVTVQGVASMTPVQVNQTQVGGAAVVADPCQANTKLNATVSQTSSGTFITGTSGKRNYICSLMIVASAAANVSLVEYSGTCTGGTAYATLGSTTASSGPSLAANGGLTIGGGQATVVSGAGNANTGYNVCLLQNGSATVVAQATYVQQ